MRGSGRRLSQRSRPGPDHEGFGKPGKALNFYSNCDRKPPKVFKQECVMI